MLRELPTFEHRIQLLIPNMQLRFLANEELFREAIEPIYQARSFVWIGTADIKDLHVQYHGRVVSFLSVLNDLCKKKVAIRLLHAREAGPNFRKSFDKYPALLDHLERQLCPRVHFKHIIIDGKLVYTGSANLTGAGLGMKGVNTRNFESGIVSSDPVLVEQVMNQFDEVWMGKFCGKCQRRQYCGDPIL